MRKKQFRTLRRCLLVLALALILAVGVAAGRYYTTVPLKGTVTFSASLAQSVVVQEHVPQRNSDGSYSLTAGVTTNGVEYTLIPGLDVPKDPHIVITGKTAVPAYLYLVVEDSLDAAITYELDPCWQEVKANVYVYCKDGTPVVIDQTTAGLESVNIIKDQTVYVSQTLTQGEDSGDLVFSVVLKEVGKVTDNGAVRQQTPAEVYG